ncbi:MAG: ABC transporter permease [Hyphomicrobiaceae bacterium]
MGKIVELSWSALALCAILLLWETCCRLIPIPNYVLPTPLAIAQLMVERSGVLIKHGLVTLREILLGFAIATTCGVLLGIAIAQSRFVERALLPLLVASQSVPTIALAPILIIWFGPTDVARLAVVFIISFFPIVVSTISGLKQVNIEFIDLVRGLGVGPVRLLLKIKLPAALPQIFTGMRISIVLAVIGAVVGEFVASTQGLGYLIFTSAANLEVTLMFSAVVLLAVFGITLYQTLALAQWIAIPWAPGTREMAR